MADAKIEERVNENDESHLMTEEQLAQESAKIQNTFVGYFLPLLRIEVKRFCLMAFTFFLIAFVYSFLRLYKDTVIHSVLEPAAQNWLKLCTFLVSFLMVGLIQKLLLNYTIDKVFEIATIFFGLSLFALAILIKFKESPFLQKPLGWAEDFFNSDNATVRGIGIVYMPVLIFNHWILSLFYILCEVISSIMVSYLFLTYTNSHCTNDQNKRFVRLFYIFSNVAGWSAAESYDLWNTRMKKRNLVEKENYYVYFTFASVAIFFIVLVLKKILDKVFQTPIVIKNAAKAKKPAKSKKSVSISDGVYYAVTSKLLLAMSTMTLFYNISANLLGSSMFANALSSCAKVYGYEKSAFAGEYKALEMKSTAILVIFIMFSPVAKLYEWFGVASTAGVPLLFSFIGSLMVCYLAVKNFPALGEDNMRIASYFNDATRNPLLEVRVNLVVAAAVKLSKYAFFDIIKEALSMKINPEIRPLFKGVYDGVCGKLGKCLSAVYGLVMEHFTGHRDSRYYAPVSFIILTCFGILWGYAIYYLHKSFKKATENGTYMSPDFIEGFKLKEE